MDELRAKGHWLSMMSRVTGPESEIPLWEWSLAPPFMQDAPETREKLLAQGFIEAPQEPPLLAYHMLSQLGRAVFLGGRIWAHKQDIEQARKAPVSLVFSLHLDTEETVIPLVSPLPIPSVGEYALVGDKPICYNITQLPEAAQARWRQLIELLYKLSPSKDVSPFSELHAVSENQEAYQAMLARLFAATRKGKRADRTQATHDLQLLEQAYREVLEARKAWITLSAIDKWKEVQSMMHELAADYNAHHKKVAEGMQNNKPIPQIANVFANQGMARVISTLPFQAYTYATAASADEWSEVSSGSEKELILSNTYSKKSGTTFVQIREKLEDIAQRDALLAKMWEQVQRRSELHCDVYLAMQAQLEGARKDASGWTCITAHQILNYRGITPKTHRNDSGRERRAGHRREDLERIAECVDDIKNIYIKVHEQKIDDPNPQPGAPYRQQTISRESPLFIFGDVIYHNELPLDGGPVHSTPIAWEYHASKWMTPYLDGPNHKTAILIQKVLNYDYYREVWEKRLARHFMYALRINATKGGIADPIIGNVLEELHLKLAHHSPEKTRQRFEKAMNRLAEDNVLIWRYENELDLPARDWYETWRASKIIVENPPQVKSEYMRLATVAKARRAEEQKALPKPRKRASTTKKEGKK